MKQTICYMVFYLLQMKQALSHPINRIKIIFSNEKHQEKAGKEND